MCKLPSWLAGWFAFQFLTFFGCTSVLHSKVSPDDHPLVVQFAANDPAILLDAALWAQDVPMSFQQFLIGVCTVFVMSSHPYCQKLGADAVDLNLGCPQW